MNMSKVESVMEIKFPYFLFDKVSDILDLFRRYDLIDGRDVKGGKFILIPGWYRITIRGMSRKHAGLIGNILDRIYKENYVKWYWFEHKEDD